MENPSIIRFLIAGQLQREYRLLPDGKALIDIPGGSLFYAAVGVKLWEEHVGVIARAGEDYPQEWLNLLKQHKFDSRGIHILPESLDLRSFIAYPSFTERETENPVAHFARLGLEIPKSLLGYTPPPSQVNSRNHPSAVTIRINDIPADYFDASAAHLCPLDYLSHNLLSSLLRQGQITTLTLDPGSGYMTPVFWDEAHTLMKGLTALLTSEAKLRSLFQGRSSDVWEMAEDLAHAGCELIVIKRGAEGQYLYDHQERTRWKIPAYPAHIVDPTGAGHAFCGGFLAAYHTTYDALNAVLHGNIAASLTVEGSDPFFALGSLPGLAQARLTALRNRIEKV